MNDLLKRIIQDADALLITAGAGMGVDSGLPDFRGNDGFWNAYPQARMLGLSFIDLANPDWFIKDPQLAWAFYGHRLNLYRQTVPHEGFRWLLELGSSKPKGYFVATSNVDGQFQKAGFNETRIWEAHGSIHHMQCSKPHCEGIYSADTTEVHVDMEQFKALAPLPTCPTCKAIARPNILMFGDWFWQGERSDAQHERFITWLGTLGSSSLVIIELGAGTAIPTMRDLGERLAKTRGATLIHINPSDAQVPQGAYWLAVGALEGLRQLLRRDVSHTAQFLEQSNR
ncbi:MAG: NAD-dependent deacetylase [Campylobacterales bacterium]|nr:NAD-dependent deacetylase [Campylobacterales bacterium]